MLKYEVAYWTLFYITQVSLDNQGKFMAPLKYLNTGKTFPTSHSNSSTLSPKSCLVFLVLFSVLLLPSN